jgi:aminoglycoside phosphotransferase (APT) family kinase protein
MTDWPVVHAGIELCMQPEVVREQLQHCLPSCNDGSHTVQRVHVMKVRRNTSQWRNPNPITLCYEVDARSCANDDVIRWQFYGKVFRNGASAQAVSSTHALHIARLDMLLWTWPDDPGLPQLPQLLGPRSTLAWRDKPVHDACVLRYVPECRATLRYTYECAEKNSRYLFVKTFNDERGEAIHQRFTYFWELSQLNTDAPLVAQPLAYCSATRSMWQAQAAGSPLASSLTSATQSLLAHSLALAMGVLHAAPLTLAGSAVRDTAHWLAEIRRRRNKLMRAAPDMGDRVMRITEVMEHLAGNLPPYQPTLIHGDLHPEQVWLDGARIVLFDFDEFSLGDPMEDLAAFITKIQPDGADSALANLLLIAYARSVPERFDYRRLRWHLALQQLLQASRAFVYQMPDWRGELARRIESIETLCALTDTECAV